MPASVYLWGLHMQLEKEILEGKGGTAGESVKSQERGGR